MNRTRPRIVSLLGPDLLGTQYDGRRSRMSAQSRGSPDAVVIGAGPAGLAVARELDYRHGIKALVLDRAAAPAISWRTRYDNFRLNTTGHLSHLPGQRIPLTAGRWPTREDMVRYFDRYVQRQHIRLMLGCEVHRVDRAAGAWQLNTPSGEIVTRAPPSDIFLGLFSRVPARVVVPVISVMTRLMWGDLTAYGFARPSLGLKATVETRGRIPTLADELVDAVRRGRVEVVGAVKAFGSGGVILGDGTTVAPQAIIAATGFGTDLERLVGHLGVLDEHGHPHGGFASHVGDGLFAIGYGIPPNGPLRAIRLNATPLAGEVAAYLKRTAPSVRAPSADLAAAGRRLRAFDGGVPAMRAAGTKSAGTP